MQGGIIHKDLKGQKSIIKAGDVQVNEEKNTKHIRS